MKDNSTVFEVSTDRRNDAFWVVATSPGRAITKLKRKGKKLLDRGEKITGVRIAGEIDIA